MPDVRTGCADGRAAIAHGAGGVHHQAAEGHDGHVAGADPLLGAIADRAHSLPHRDVLVRNAADAGEVSLFHGGAILTVKIVARSLAVEITIDVDAPFEHVEFAPRLGVDAGLVTAVPG